MDWREWLTHAEAMTDEIVAWRRDFHQHPELGYEETRTAGIVAEHLRSCGLQVRTGVGKTGVVGLLQGDEPGPTVLLRADMDALPIPDQKAAPYASRSPGKAHLCGHDGHTSMLMAAARLLTTVQRPRRGAIKFMFQPAEEGLAGARAMIEDGVLDSPRVDAAIALHVLPSVPTGRITVSRGICWASTDRLEIRIIGKGGHAAAPHQTVDAIPIAAQVVTALQHVASRQTNPLDSVVVTIGQINGGYACNVIAPEVKLIGTMRTLDSEVRAEVRQRIRKIVQGVAETYGATAEIDIIEGYPPVVNDDRMVDHLLETCDSVLGTGRSDVVRPSMGGEDFAFVAQRVPAVMFRLGTGSGEDRTAYPLHHPMFDLDERALPVGAALLSAAALRYLDAK